MAHNIYCMNTLHIIDPQFQTRSKKFKFNVFLINMGPICSLIEVSKVLKTQRVFHNYYRTHEKNLFHVIRCIFIKILVLAY